MSASTTIVPPPVAFPSEKQLNNTEHVEHTTTNGAASAQSNATTYKIKPQQHSQRRQLRVIHVGAGAAGLCMAYKMQAAMKDYDLICYEKNSEVGGTWYENRYPGCACDVPAHAYTYSWEPNPDWSSFYAYGPEIKKYFQTFAEKHDLMKYVQLNSKVLKAVWDEEKGIWEVELEVNGQVVKDWCHVFVNGTGFLNNWKWPAIEGLQNFTGKLMHSASWDNSIDWKGKRVAVIGTGSSAIQIVPQIQKTAEHMTCFMRSVTWISPAVGADVLAEERQSGGGDAPPNMAQYYFSEQEKVKFKEDPEYHLGFRKKLEGAVNNLFEMFVKDSPTSKAADQMMRAEMHRRIGEGHEELKEKLIPKWPPGCRRITPGDGYLEALVKPNVTTCHREIAKVVPEGVVDETGQLHRVDILVCATGFNIAFAPPYDVIGMNGISMREAWTPDPLVYLALTTPSFPNYFIVNGVRGNWAAGTSLPSHEVCIDYIIACAKRIQAEGIKCIEVKEEPVRQLYEHIDKWHEGSVWGAECKSWYKNNIIGGKLWIWGGSALHFMKTVMGGDRAGEGIKVRWEHYDLRYPKGQNMWEFLGNGQVEAEIKKDVPALTPYMRNSDTAWGIY